MTSQLNQEFNTEFDIIYNGITSNQAPGLDLYEKSVFLTQAQEELVRSCFDPRRNKVQEGFDSNELRQIQFSSLIQTDSYTTDDFINEESQGFAIDSTLVKLDDNLLAIVNESVDVTRGRNTKRLTVVPLTYTEYSRLSSRPFKRPLKDQAWRILNTKVIDNRIASVAELIAGYNDIITAYNIRYVKKPDPIILENLGEGLYIDGIATETPCKLDKSTHRDIIKRACELAKAYYMTDLQSQVMIGQTSATDIGVIPQNK